ncbi:sensor histidine kinase [Actinomycetospora termitidis]|uniref:histidine kinase n=1 Tax=Actinomycetospora termitidis TaxID=3053470 RepID=A0ABT7M6Y0_9PSEU|nr:HAMP domain-containing sensor histidine kinase [Actinomycetospora sp. Odt1-22]MDL5156428.1 HAMP domain-containing sensor histidine kinase [Actinomycetospora sp. Odt1-22]
MALVVLLALSRLGAGLLLDAVVEAGDGELRDRATTARQAVIDGGPVPVGLRVTDVAGTPVDGRGPVPLADPAVRALGAGEPITVTGPGEPRRWVAVPVTLPDGSQRLVLASRDLVGAAALLGGAAGWFLPGVVVAAAVLAGAAWLAAGAALRPVGRLRAAAAATGEGERLPVPPSRDELAALAVEINALLARRDDAADRLRRFSDDAAHELRSPIASLRATADVAVAYPSSGSTEEDREAWRTVARDAERLSALVTDLLALARADGGERAPTGSVDLAAAVTEAVGRQDGEGPVVTTWVPVAVHAAATAAEVGLVLDNLLGNARKHARSVVHVSAVPAGAWVRLIVDDDGPGIPEAERARVFDRFTRVEAAAGVTGSGLGLALVARLVEGRGGSVRAAASPDGGARLAVRWPAAR